MTNIDNSTVTINFTQSVFNGLLFYLHDMKQIMRLISTYFILKECFVFLFVCLFFQRKSEEQLGGILGNFRPNVHIGGTQYTNIGSQIGNQYGRKKRSVFINQDGTTVGTQISPDGSVFNNNIGGNSQNWTRSEPHKWFKYLELGL